jgi:excisionase family DNA binding protein
MSSGFSSGSEARLKAVMAEVDALAQELPAEKLPDLFGGLEHGKRVAELRLASPLRVPEVNVPLLTVAETADLLKVTKATIYRWTKGKLRNAVVKIGDGSIRLDSKKIQKFIEGSRVG